MSRDFGASAARLAGATAILLGWRPSEFWASTPAELALALNGATAGCDGPDEATIEQLRRQYPDD